MHQARLSLPEKCRDFMWSSSVGDHDVQAGLSAGCYQLACLQVVIPLHRCLLDPDQLQSLAELQFILSITA